MDFQEKLIVCPPLPQGATAHLLQKQVEAANSLEWKILTREMPFEYIRHNICWWRVDNSTEITALHYQELPAPVALHVWNEINLQQAIYIDMYPGRMEGIEDIWETCVAPLFIRMTDSLLEGEVLGPFYGWAGVFDFQYALKRLSLIDRKTQAEDSFKALDYRDPLCQQAQKPWHLLQKLDEKAFEEDFSLPFD